MSATDFEYAIKKDVRNNPIIREVDAARQRQLVRSTVVVGLLVVVVLFSIVQHFELVRHGYLIEELQQQRIREEEMNRHLRLEIESLRAPGRVEDFARTKLHMVEPTREQAIVIERVVPSQPPSKAVVAAR